MRMILLCMFLLLLPFTHAASTAIVSFEITWPPAILLSIDPIPEPWTPVYAPYETANLTAPDSSA